MPGTLGQKHRSLHGGHCIKDDDPEGFVACISESLYLRGSRAPRKSPRRQAVTRVSSLTGTGAMLGTSPLSTATNASTSISPACT